MKMISTQLPKKTKEELKKGMTLEVEGERWPYGLKLRFGIEQVDKLPHMKKFKVGDKVTMQGMGEVVSVSSNERIKGKEDYSVEVQLKEVGCEGKGKVSRETMGEAMNRAMESHRT